MGAVEDRVGAGGLTAAYDRLLAAADAVYVAASDRVEAARAAGTSPDPRDEAAMADATQLVDLLESAVHLTITRLVAGAGRS